MLMYDDKFETKENKILNQGKNWTTTYTFVMLSHKLIILPMHLVSFSLYKAMVP